MGFIDFVVNRSFRDEPQGRVVVFSGLVRGQGVAAWLSIFLGAAGLSPGRAEFRFPHAR